MNKDFFKDFYNSRLWYNRKTLVDDGVTSTYQFDGFYKTASEAKTHAEKGYKTLYCNVPEFIKLLVLSKEKEILELQARIQEFENKKEN